MIMRHELASAVSGHTRSRRMVILGAHDGTTCEKCPSYVPDEPLETRLRAVTRTHPFLCNRPA